MILTCTSDQQYYPLLKILTKSIAVNAPEALMFVRLVNCEDFHAEELKTIHNKIEVLFDNKPLCTKRKKLQRSGALLQDEMFDVYEKCDHPGKFRGAKWLYSEKMAYCSNIKFNTINMLLNRGEEAILHMDVDAIIRKPLDELYGVINRNDVSIFIETNNGVEYPQGGVIDHKKIPETDYYDRLQGNTVGTVPCIEWHAGLFGIKNTKISRNFFKTIEQKINNPSEMYDWEADQTLFNETYQQMKDSIDIYCLPRKFKDETFDDESVVWCGAGEHKFQNVKFIKEQQIYS